MGAGPATMSPGQQAPEPHWSILHLADESPRPCGVRSRPGRARSPVPCSGARVRFGSAFGSGAFAMRYGKDRAGETPAARHTGRSKARTIRCGMRMLKSVNAQDTDS